MTAPRIVWRLERRCDACHNGHHAQCERVLYASPAAREVPCECPCRTATVTVTIDDPRHPDYDAHTTRREESEACV